MTCKSTQSGIHNFESHLVETIPPSADQLPIDIYEFKSTQETVSIIKSLSAERYIVVCSCCGMTIPMPISDVKEKE